MWWWLAQSPHSKRVWISAPKPFPFYFFVAFGSACACGVSLGTTSINSHRVVQSVSFYTHMNVGQPDCLDYLNIQTVWQRHAEGRFFSGICINLVQLLVSCNACWILNWCSRPVIQSVSSSAHLAHCCRSQINQANLMWDSCGLTWAAHLCVSFLLVVQHFVCACTCWDPWVIYANTLFEQWEYIDLISGGKAQDLSYSPSLEL